jgi:hypothetical protein
MTREESRFATIRGACVDWPVEYAAATDVCLSIRGNGTLSLTGRGTLEDWRESDDGLRGAGFALGALLGLCCLFKLIGFG